MRKGLFGVDLDLESFILAIENRLSLSAVRLYEFSIFLGWGERAGLIYLQCISQHRTKI